MLLNSGMTATIVHAISTMIGRESGRIANGPGHRANRDNRLWFETAKALLGLESIN
jgi:hypothetical protein